jgi:hypothetical protein
VIDSPRDNLIGKVLYGEMTPSEAEAEAAHLKIGPLECRPDAKNFDPMEETFWTLPMAVAWIAYRTEDKVREWWDPYRAECWDWHFRKWQLGFDGPIYEGYALEQRSGATLARLRLSDLYDRASRDVAELTMSVKDAKEAALWVALREGMIKALGVDPHKGVRDEIPAHLWHDLECHEERDRDVVQTPMTSPGPGIRYEQVIVWRKAITGMWPDKMPPLPTLPETMSPTGPGYMPLYCAAQWIATNGGKRIFDPNDEAIWRNVFGELLARISSEQVKTIGMRNGERELVPAHHFAACRVDYPFLSAPLELILGEELYLQSYPYVDEKHWSSGFDDSLRDRRGERWSRLMVLKDDVARIWPFVDDRRSESGAPGRPSSMYLVEARFKLRCEAGEVANTLSKEAEFLAQWLGKAHADKPPLQQKTICNRLRPLYREYQKARN